MITLSFAQTPDKSSSKENIALHFFIEDEMHINKFHAMCKRFALALGYTEESVEKCFGKTNYEYLNYL